MVQTEFGEHVLLDDDVAFELRRVRIHLDDKGRPYFYRYHGRRKLRFYLQRYMERRILGYQPCYLNGNKLDLRRSNLQPSGR